MKGQEPCGPPAGCYTPGAFIAVSVCWVAHVPAMLAIHIISGYSWAYKWLLTAPLLLAHAVFVCLLTGFVLSNVWRLRDLSNPQNRAYARRALVAAHFPFAFFSWGLGYLLFPLWTWLLESAMKLGYAVWFQGYWRQMIDMETPEVEQRSGGGHNKL